MSRAEIVAVCELAAHLATHWEANARKALEFIPYVNASKCAADAMDLQRLGRSARNNATRLCNIPDYQGRHDIQAGNIHAKASAILKPYGLKASVGGDPRGCCLFILGLPGNTLGVDEEGFGI